MQPPGRGGDVAEPPFDAFLLLSFGGPEGPDEVLPFLRNVTRGRNVPEERLREVAHHYDLFGGISPINGQNRALLAALSEAFAAAGMALPLYWGNRNWHPLLADTLRDMRAEGRKRALAFVTSAYGSYSGCRQYSEDLARARAEAGPEAPAVELLPLFFEQAGFVAASAARLAEALARVPGEARARVPLVFTAHSIPVTMSAASPYLEQVRRTCSLVGERSGRTDWTLVFQSRSGPPGQPWLEPDVCDHLRALAAAGETRVVLMPIGFISDHMEVVYDLDTEARQVAQELGLELVRAATVSTHPAFVAMIIEQVQAALSGAAPRACAADCCPPPAIPAGRPGARP
jgi:ferrochelatase